MRDIKFRGKRVDNDKWAKGWYLEDAHGQCFIASTDTNSIPISANRVKSLTGSHDIVILGAHEVVPSTVGQFTGLLDKNGKEIYEGDIVRGIWQVNHKDVREGVVNYWEKFGLYGLNDNSSLVSIVWSGCEVIGNIHENPELLNV